MVDPDPGQAEPPEAEPADASGDQIGDPQSAIARSIGHVMKRYVRPEIERRQEEGLAPKPLNLRSFQLIVHADGRPMEIRLNEEVNAVATAILSPGTTKSIGDAITVEEFRGFEGLSKPRRDEPDAGHYTVVIVNGVWYASFDFRYNRTRAEALVLAANEFLQSARESLEAGRLRVASDLLFSAAELTAHADLAVLPLGEFAHKASHRGISTKVNQFSRGGRVPGEFRDAFNRLGALRDDQRYVRSGATVTASELNELLGVVERRLTDVQDSLAPLGVESRDAIVPETE